MCLGDWASSAKATAYTWNTTGAAATTYTWSTASNWSPSGSPGASGDTATISNALPSAWASGTSTVQLDAAANVNMSALTLIDANQPNAINFRVSKNATIQTINQTLDGSGSLRSFWTIDAGITLTVNKIDCTTINGNNAFLVINGGNVTTSVLAMTPDGTGTATWNYVFSGGNQDLTSLTWDTTAATKIAMTKFVGPQQMEFRSANVKLGNASAAQVWTTSNGGVPLRLEWRTVGETNDFIRVSANNVDMGKRLSGDPNGASDGLSIERSVTGDFGGNTTRNLLGDASGNQVAGTVTIASYKWQQSSNVNPSNNLGYDKLNSNLVLNGGKFQMLGTNSAAENDVNQFWVTPGKTLQVQTSTGDIIINDQFAAGTSTGAAGGSSLPGRMGIYFSGGTLDARGNLQLLGPVAGANAYLNDGTSSGDSNAANSAIKVGGNVQIQSRNATGFATFIGVGATPGTTGSADDFDLRSTTLTMDGGGSHTLEWTSAAALKSFPPTLSAGDFSQANFMLAKLVVTNSTSVTFADSRALYLGSDLIIDPGSQLALGGSLSQIHLLDPDLSEFTRLRDYIADGRLTGWRIVTTAGVGISLVVPEPAQFTILALSWGLVFSRRLRRMEMFV